MPIIHKLPPDTIKKIAAGEVVERPASIVKELIENSIDAGSKNIELEIKNGGIDYIRLADDGAGIEKDDLPLTIELHATSKLLDIKELENIMTLGFRGEALASINAVSDLEIISSTGSEANKISENDKIEPAARNQGTTITIKNLFRQVPARRKFLKTANTEEANIRTLLKQFAILHPEVSFSYTADNKEIFKLQPQAAKNRIAELLTGFSEKDLIPVEGEYEGIKLSGHITHPRKAMKRPQQYIFVNNRVIKSPLITSAVKRGYGNKLPPELNPHFFLQLNLDKSLVDVNVHPRKEEVKFSDDSQIFKSVLKIVDECLASDLRQEFENRFTVDQSHEKQFKPSTFNTPSTKKESSTYTYPSTNSVMNFSRNLLEENNGRISKNSNFTNPTEFNYLQIFSTYILIEKDNNLLIIDQHAADERVKYERISNKYNKDEIASTPLLLPETTTLPKSTDKKLIQALTEELTDLGFSIESNEYELKIKAIPSISIEKLNLTETFAEISSEIESGEINLDNIKKSLDLVCATIACHSSIRARERLSTEKVRKLIEDLWECESPYTCPHGRPIVNEISRSELETMFKRRK